MEKEVRVERPEFGSLVGVAYFDQKEVYPWPDGFGLPDWRVNERVLPRSKPTSPGGPGGSGGLPPI